MQAPAASDSLVGFTLIDKYKVLRPIGRGGMGEVYEAQHVELGKRVAVKVMLGKYAEDSEAIARFKREALAASRIGNPHIIDVSDIGTTHDGRSFVVMEFLDGQPLSNVIERGGPMPAWRAIDVMRQVLRAVHVAHQKGIIHRDLKPDNIFLVTQDQQQDFVKLLDFGISKIVDLDAEVAATKLTTTGVVMGTPLYMAPEQAMGNPTDHHADIYACGVMLYEMLAGKPPFDGQTYAVLVAKLLTSEPQPLDQLRAGLPRSLVNAVHKALQKEPEDRFSSAEQFAQALPSERPPSSLEMAATIDSGRQVVLPRPKGKKRPLWPWLAAGVALAAGGTIGLLLAIDGGSGKAAQTAPAPPPGTPTGELIVKSTPTAATVLVDGEKKGTTPLQMRLAAGKHQIHVELDGYASSDQEWEVAANERSSIGANLPKIQPQQPLLVEQPKGSAAVVQKAKPHVETPKQPPRDLTVARPPPVPTQPLGPPTQPLPPPQVPVKKDPPPQQPSTDVRKPNPYQ